MCSAFDQLTFNCITKASIGLEDDSFENVLRDSLPELVAVEDFAPLYSADAGAGSYCPLRLFALLLLQTNYNELDRDAVRRARRDLGWRYAMRLGPTGAAPSRTSFQRFRGRLVATLGEDFIHQRVLRLARKGGLLDDVELHAITFGAENYSTPRPKPSR
ncbi:MAG: hypothetical protein ACI9OJ_004803 [Myxococcota bacterium]